MSDYLANLAARSLNAATTVQPRLASRFETSFAAARLTPEDGFGLETGVAVERRAPPVPPAFASPNQDGCPCRDRPRRRIRSRPLRGRRWPASESRTSRRHQRTRQARGLPSPRSTGRPAAAASQDSERPDVPTRWDAGSRRSAAVPPLRTQVPSLWPTNRPPSPKHRASVPSLLAGTRCETLPRAARIRPALTPRVTPTAMTPRSAAEQREPGPAATPTIRVTIGRVEVRAIVPPAPAPPRAAPARSGPMISLDEYLKQRNGGRR